MENCTIYSHNLNFEKILQIVKSNLPKAKVEYKDSGTQKSLVTVIEDEILGDIKILNINYRERINPSYKLEQVECGLTQNLAGMVNFIQSLPAENEHVRNQFLHKVMSVNCEMSFVAEPEITNEFEAILHKIVAELDAFIFAEPTHIFSQSNSQHFLDKQMNLILDMDGRCEVQDVEVNVNAKYLDEPQENYNDEQLGRKAKTEAFLKSNGIKINQNLPCLPTSENITLRSTKDVIDRAYALLIIALKGEGLEQEDVMEIVEEKNINSFTPEENYIYKAEELSDKERAYATWGYESLYTMLWALDVMNELTYPSEICDVPRIVEELFHPSREEFESTVKLRNKSEILDELDKIYRMNWACVDARIKGQQVTGNINSSVVYERHCSLNWLINYQNQDWDDVQTNT